MKSDYDVVVIGGGPAGSSFARVAAENGMDVLVIDKRKEIGVPVRCGEGLGAREVVAQGLEIPRRAISTDIYGAKVVAPNGKEIVWKEEGVTTGWVLERKIFDKWLCELAIDKGAEVRTYTRALDLVKENGKIVGVKVAQWGKDEHEIRAPLIVSAEGMEAHIARKAGFDAVHRLYDVDTCYQYEMKPYEHENLIELYFGNKIAPRGYCLTPDTEIIAKNTVKPINNVNVGEEVLTLNGWTPVTATSERDYDGKIVRITPFMLNQSAGLTVDHLVFVWNKKIGFHWKKAGELKKSKRGSHRNGDYLVFPLPKRSKNEEIEYIKVSDYVKEGYIEENGYLYPKGENQGAEFKYKLNHKIKNQLELTPELLEFFGYFVSEGNVSSGAVIISNADSKIVNRVKEIGTNIFGFEPHIFEQKDKGHPGKKYYQVQFASPILGAMFKALFGEGCENKKLPHFVHALDKKLKLALLKGLLKGESSKWKSSEGKDIVSYVSISKSLIYDIWMLLAGIGIVGAIRKNKKKGAYEIRLRGKHFFLKDNYIILGIRNLKVEHYKGKVYDIESSGSFCPFFAVHNCWIFPKSDRRANVGIGIGGNLTNGDKNGLPGADPKRLLDEFIANHPQLKDASTLDDFGGVISVGAPLDEFVKDNFMVIGTAAKQVDPIHGGGIALAMECGVLAADVAVKAKSKGYTKQSLMEYEKRWKETTGKKVAKRLLLRKVLEKLNDDDLNHIFNSITQKDLNDVMAGNFAGPVTKVVAGRPQLLKVLSALIS